MADQGAIDWAKYHAGEGDRPAGYNGEATPEIKMSDLGGSAVDFAKGLDSNINGAFQQYLDKSQSLKNPLQMYDEATTAAGIPQLRSTAGSLQGQINDVEDAIRRVEGTVNATTRNSLVTEGQRENMIQDRQNPLRENLGTLSIGLGRIQSSIDNAEQGINTRIGYATAANEQALDPYRMQIQLKSESAARQMTGFSSDRETRLSLLLDKLNRQERMDQREHDEMVQLAKEERDYTRQKDLLIFQNEQDLKKSEAEYQLKDKYSNSSSSTFAKNPFLPGGATQSGSNSYNIGNETVSQNFMDQVNNGNIQIGQQDPDYFTPDGGGGGW